ncbi:hypothetical protein B5P41_30425, partial [Bacillus sp. SRB_28]
IHKDLIVQTPGSISLYQSLTNNSGDVLLAADSDANGTGSFVVAPSKTLTVSLSGASVQISAADIVLDPTCVLQLGSSKVVLASSGTLELH